MRKLEIMRDVTTDGSEAIGGPSTPFGPFWLDRRLAVGGSAEVYLARPRTGQHPAPRFIVKRLLSRADRDDAFRMLAREAELNQAVRHPNVVEVYGAGQVEGEPYLAMEYVEGVDLFRLLRRAEGEQRRLPPELAAYLAGRIANALQAVHGAVDFEGHPLDIVHRDVTPSNVYLSNDGGVKLGDFGIARVSQPRARGPQPAAGLKGKFGYLAPEQIAGEAFDHRADLFAAAVILGEMLIGTRVFPGSGQLAVLLAIRDGNFEPLRRREQEIPAGLYQICLKGLTRDPAARFQSADELAAALALHEKPSQDELRTILSSWVRWAGDSAQLAKRLKGQIRDSVDRMRAVRSQSRASQPGVTVSGSSKIRLPSADSVPPSERQPARVRYANGRIVSELTFPRLVEMVVTGEVCGDDEVELMGGAFRRIREIESLARHLMPSTTATTSRLFAVGVPDYQMVLREEPMLEILGRLRSNAETGALFVERRDRTGLPRRKEIYLQQGRLLHVASTERDELLGEYLVRRGALSRGDLDAALEQLSTEGGSLGDTLVAMGIVDGVDVFRAIRDQGRDRVAALCTWTKGVATFYRDTTPNHVAFPLDLDLASPMMAGVLMTSKGAPRGMLPKPESLVIPGPRAPTMASRRERGTAPVSLVALQRLVTQGLDIESCIREITVARSGPGSRAISENEVCAALVVGRVLGWVSFQETSTSR